MNTRAIVAILGAGIVIGWAAACRKNEAAPPAEKGRMTMDVKKEPFGTLPDGAAVDVYTLAGGRGLEARVITYGATLISVKTPDRNGVAEDVTLGFDKLDGYLGVHPFFGSTVGRVANRIAKGMFTLDGVKYVLARNDGENHLHGGLKGFDKYLWAAEPVKTAGAVGVRLSRTSADMEEGYPGRLQVAVTFSVTESGELRIEYEAETDKATPVNLTNHAYWNLSGEGDILAHELTLAAARYTPVGPGLIPTGEVAPVTGTPMDFTVTTPVGERIASVEGGYDHNFVLDSGGGVLDLAAMLYDPKSGREMTILTDEPAIQFYTGNFLDGTIKGKSGRVYGKHAGLCLETQHYPDSVNHPEFPSTILRPGEKFKSTTVHRFATR